LKTNSSIKLLFVLFMNYICSALSHYRYACKVSTKNEIMQS